MTSSEFNFSLRKLMRSLRKKVGLIRCLHHYWRLNQSRSKDEIPGRARREERLSRSKLKQAFLIDSDAELFMYLHLCSSLY